MDKATGTEEASEEGDEARQQSVKNSAEPEFRPVGKGYSDMVLAGSRHVQD